MELIVCTTIRSGMDSTATNYIHIVETSDGKHLARIVLLATPWDVVAVDLVGLWTIKVEGMEY